MGESSPTRMPVLQGITVRDSAVGFRGQLSVLKQFLSGAL